MDELNPAAGDPVGLRDHPECNFVCGPSFGMVEVRNLISCWGQLLGVNRIPMLCKCLCLSILLSEFWVLGTNSVSGFAQNCNLSVI
jgi:hypothetical protein